MVSVEFAESAPVTAAAEASPPRSGAELVRASQGFQAENRWTSWRLLLETLVVLGTGLWLVFHFQAWPLQISAGLLVGLVQVRLFIFYHDTLHGALFARDPLAQALMSLVGIYLLTIRSVWKETHDHHHQNNARQLGSMVGTYPILSVAMAARLTPGALLRYRFARHGLTMLAGYLTLILGGMVGAAFIRQPRRHWGALVTALLHALVFAVLAWQWGWVTALCAQVVPSALSMAIGSYLFYAQHNFPGLKLARRHDWSYAGAALTSSSMFEMSPMMHWFTGSIGFHHVHHLNHRIPFYRLREAMEGMPELQSPGRTSWRLRDIRACLALYLWDPQLDRMVTYAEARATA
ncbi:MAG: fatty acid desaturase [Planctomycetes bacterium]|nr:fatty acid desaturase [Planctomycetota bacterium]